MSALLSLRFLLRSVLAAACVGCASEPHDPALRNVTVHCEPRSVDELAAESLRIEWQVVSGNLRVGNVVPRRDGAVAARPEGDREGDAAQGELRLLEGQPGRISAGVDAPAGARMLTPYGMREDASGDSGYDVTPHVLADGRVRLDFAPYDERFAPPASGNPVTRTPHPVTTATVAPGAKVAIGGLARDSTASDRFSGIGRAPARQERFFVFWAEVESPEAE